MSAAAHVCIRAEVHRRVCASRCDCIGTRAECALALRTTAHTCRRRARICVPATRLWSAAYATGIQLAHLKLMARIMKVLCAMLSPASSSHSRRESKAPFDFLLLWPYLGAILRN
eukprot:6199375-Pleurochrysis_carterae.AAC.4